MGEVVEVAPPRGVGGPGAVRVTSSVSRAPLPGGGARPGRAGAPISTMLTPDERMRVDAAGQGLYHTLHRESLEDVLRDLRTRRASRGARLGRDAAPLRPARDRARGGDRARVPARAGGRAAHRGRRRAAPRTPCSRWAERRARAHRRAAARRLARAARRRSPPTAGDDLERLAAAALAADLAGAPEDCRALLRAAVHAAAARAHRARARPRAGRSPEHAHEPLLPRSACRRPSATSPWRASCAPRACSRTRGCSIAARRQPPRVLVAAELRPPRAHAARPTRRRVPRALRRRGDAAPLPRGARDPVSRALSKLRRSGDASL